MASGALYLVVPKMTPQELEEFIGNHTPKKEAILERAKKLHIPEKSPEDERVTLESLLRKDDFIFVMPSRPGADYVHVLEGNETEKAMRLFLAKVMIAHVRRELAKIGFRTRKVRF